MILTNVELLKKEKISILPKRATQYSAGYDVFAEKEIKISPKTKYEISLPFSFQSDESNEAMNVLVLPRSSYGIKKKLRILEDGKVVKYISLFVLEPTSSVVLYNDSDVEVVIPKGEGFLQIVLTKETDVYQPAKFFSVSENTKKEFSIHPFSVQEKDSVFSLINHKEIEIGAKEQVLLPTGFKSSFDRGNWMGATITSSLENDLIFSNLTPVIDADYYDNPDNEGLIFVSLVNTSDKPLRISSNEELLYFWCKPFYLFSNDVSTDEQRKGGIGSTTGK